MSTDRKTLSISIIIPALNESETLGRCLQRLVSVRDVEVIVADGGSTDSTIDTARAHGATTLHAAPGKASQMNAGAQKAQGDILLFLHADTELPQGFADRARDALSLPGIAAGAFRLAIDGNDFGLRIIERLVNFRAVFLQMPYGDQGIFMTAENFAAVGGFPDLPIMEDFELMRRLKRKGRIRILQMAAKTSARRWQRLGVMRTTLVNQAIILGYLLGVDPKRLAKWYRKR